MRILIRGSSCREHDLTALATSRGVMTSLLRSRRCLRRSLLPLLPAIAACMNTGGAARPYSQRGANRGGGYGRGSGTRGGSGFYEEKDDSGAWRERDARREYKSDGPRPENVFPDGFEALYGVSPVLSALRTERRTFKKLFMQDTLANEVRSDRPALQEVDRLAQDLGITVELRDKGTLNGMSRNRPHQGIVIQASPLDFEPLDKKQVLPTPKAGEAPVWLALDEVTDPQNLGALIRSALFLGVDGVLVSAKNSCPLTPTVSKASAGAMEVMKVHAARNLPRTLEAAKEAGWQVAGAALAESVEPEQLEHSAPTVLVLGSEGKGLRTNVLRACSDVVRIPRGMSGAASEDDAALVDSLNVSVAGGILLYSLITARRLAAAAAAP